MLPLMMGLTLCEETNGQLTDEFLKKCGAKWSEQTDCYTRKGSCGTAERIRTLSITNVGDTECVDIDGYEQSEKCLIECPEGAKIDCIGEWS